MTTNSPYIIIACPGSSTLLGDCYTYDYTLARKFAGALGGIVTNAGWYRRTFGIDPLQRLKAIDQPPRMGRRSRGGVA